MNALTADFLTNLAAELGGAIIPALARRLRDGWQGDASARAIEACLPIGLVVLTTQAQKTIHARKSRPICAHRRQRA